MAVTVHSAIPTFDKTFTLETKDTYFANVSDSAQKLDKIVKFSIAVIFLFGQIVISVQGKTLAAQRLQLFGTHLNLVRMTTAIFMLINGVLKANESAQKCLKGEAPVTNFVKTGTFLSDTMRTVCATNGMIDTVAQCGSSQLAAITPVVHLVRHTWKFLEYPSGCVEEAGEFEVKKGKKEPCVLLSAGVMAAAIELFLSAAKVGGIPLGSVYVGLVLNVVASGTSLYLDWAKKEGRAAS